MNQRCKDIRKNIVRISHDSGHGHLPSCFSVIEMLVALYGHMNHFPDDPGNPERDIFLLSKGHAALGLYCVLADQGYFSVDNVCTFGGFGSTFGCHADRTKIPGIEASTGSLGHGIGLAVGVAQAAKIRKSGQQVYALVGDGEANEGSVWESLLVAESLGLDNLTVFYDDNRSHSRGLQIGNPAEKLAAFGCQVHDVNGHDIDAITAALQAETDRPKAIVGRTIKGFGSRLLADNQHEWHRKSPNDEQLEIILGEIDAAAV
ncbi:transketolase [uncultured Pseudodesulfovibrio sp.]|uniref:transketolase n=1 Tax=uncultured Pseudodesulfovibrio sp. TaxID=2035858 RepID=UPI0029C79BAB|nr:transketolase [uncultured Pseudodesulfovibrio sp.]